MKKIFETQLVRTVFPASFIVFAVLAVVTPASCRLTEEGIEIFPADTTPPAIEDFSVTGAKSIVISCTEKIVLDEIAVSACDDGENVFAVANVVSYSESQKAAEIELSSATEVGKSYVVSGIVHDITGNTLEFSQKFCGYNENPARLIFNEIRTTYSKDKLASEYVEFYVLKGGNTYGLEMVSSANGEAKKYSFPAIEVSQGEYITLHGRVFEGTEEAALDETGSDLTLSKVNESCDTARDLWKSGNEKIVSNTDVVVLRDSVSLVLKDAVLLSAPDKTAWSKKLMAEFAENASTLGIWKGGALPENAVCTNGMSSSLMRSISRQNTALLASKYAEPSKLPYYIPTSASDWIVTEKTGTGKNTVSGATPGWENSTNSL